MPRLSLTIKLAFANKRGDAGITLHNHRISDLCNATESEILWLLEVILLNDH